MARIIVLDSSPLGLAARRPNLALVSQCLSWLSALESSGALIVIPEIADYEVRRELIRARILSGVVGVHGPLLRLRSEIATTAA